MSGPTRWDDDDAVLYDMYGMSATGTRHSTCRIGGPMVSGARAFMPAQLLAPAVVATLPTLPTTACGAAC